MVFIPYFASFWLECRENTVKKRHCFLIHTHQTSPKTEMKMFTFLTAGKC